MYELVHQRTAEIAGIVAIVVLVLWQRRLGSRLARWEHAVLVGLELAIVAGVVVSSYRLSHITLDGDGGSKASQLAHALSNGLLGDRLAIGAVALAVLVLGIATFRRARVLPEARVR